MNVALVKRRVANLAPAGARGFLWYAEALTDSPRANAGIAPDGTNTAVKITANTNAKAHLIVAFPPGNIPDIPQGSLHTFSVFVKSAGWRYVRISFEWYYADHYLDLDLLTGTYAMPPAGDGRRPRACRVETLPDGWYRVSITEVNTETAGGMSARMYFVDAAGNPNIPGDGTSGILLWGYQINTGGPAPYNPAPPLI